MIGKENEATLTDLRSIGKLTHVAKVETFIGKLSNGDEAKVTIKDYGVSGHAKTRFLVEVDNITERRSTSAYGVSVKQALMTLGWELLE